jgi:hypothetical protein
MVFLRPKEENMSDYKIAEQTESFKAFLKGSRLTVIDNECSEGWVRWRGYDYEGVVRITASGIWELVADSLKVGFDRCANAQFHWKLNKVSEDCLRRALLELSERISPC